MKTSCYLVVRADRRSAKSPIRGVKVVAVRAGVPALMSGEAAIKVTLDVPEAVFDPAEVTLVVSPRDVILAAEQEPVDG